MSFSQMVMSFSQMVMSFSQMVMSFSQMVMSKNDDVFLTNDELFLMGGLSFFDVRIIGKSSAIFRKTCFRNVRYDFPKIGENLLIEELRPREHDPAHRDVFLFWWR
jgi:hypothetical protein